MSGLGSSSALHGHVCKRQNSALPARLIQTPGARSGSPSSAWAPPDFLYVAAVSLLLDPGGPWGLPSS